MYELHVHRVTVQSNCNDTYCTFGRLRGKWNVGSHEITLKDQVELKLNEITMFTVNWISTVPVARYKYKFSET